jgi:peptide/nickel transport system substrate-binding protein
MISRRWALLAVPLVGAAMIGAYGQEASASHRVPPMVLSVDPGSPLYTKNFNPFSPNARWAQAWIYETLYYIDGETGQQTPWLAPR